MEEEYVPWVEKSLNRYGTQGTKRRMKKQFPDIKPLDIEKAIHSSDLGINPATSGDVIRVILPDLTEETRRDLIKVAKSEAENSKISAFAVSTFFVLQTLVLLRNLSIFFARSEVALSVKW